MSRIGKKPVLIPEKVNVQINGQHVVVEGPLGKLELDVRPEIGLSLEGNAVTLLPKGETRNVRAFHGLSRSLLQNMILGVTQGYERKLELFGTGYIAAVQGKTLQLRVGFANELQCPIPNGLDVKCPDQQHIVVKGIDKQNVTQFSAYVRSLRKAEPYLGKGIKYEGEAIRRKEGKAATKK